MTKIMIALVAALTLTTGIIATDSQPVEAHWHSWCGHYDKIDYGFGRHPNYLLDYVGSYQTSITNRHVHVYVVYRTSGAWSYIPDHVDHKYC